MKSVKVNIKEDTLSEQEASDTILDWNLDWVNSVDTTTNEKEKEESDE